MGGVREDRKFADHFISVCTKIIYKLSVEVNKFMQVKEVLLRAVQEFLFLTFKVLEGKSKKSARLLMCLILWL
jgi:hypothetical protein